MKALILSAGYGERLRPLTERIPKPLLEAGGRPLIHYPLLMLRHAGIRDVAINVHHLAGQIESALGDGSALGMRITFAPEKVLLGTGGPLAGLRDYFGGESLVILNCDTILGFDLMEMIRFHRERGGLATLALRESAGDYSKIEIDEEGRIRRMRLMRPRAVGGFDDYRAEAAGEIEGTLRSLMYCGALICEPKALERAPIRVPSALMGDLFAPLVSAGIPLFGYVDDSFFRTVDDLAGYENLRAEFAASPPRLTYLLDTVAA